ncbi:MAG: Gfo/Idh/MocA family oxidoreductase [Verrucomicrobiaceae bacterium]|nr:Gfo/Idh/MocA family oxidoreductase [Verrucomicrobiaceae bacterium]
MDSNGNIRVGIIGLGVGERHIRCFQAHPRCRVTALCDLDASRLASTSSLVPDARLTQNADELLTAPDIDAVSIASYDDAHCRQALRAIEHGKHLLVEKPMCVSEDEARSIRRALSAHPEIKLTSNHVLRLSSRFQELKRRISEGEFGDIYHMEGDYQYGRLHKITHGWRGRLEHYSVVLGGAIHVIDLLLWLTGDEVAEVTACGNRIASRGSGFRFDDFVVALLKLKSGAVAKVSANFGCPRPHFHAVEIHGTRKLFINRPDAAEIHGSTDKNATPELMHTPYRDYQKKELICSFIDAILGSGPPLVSPEDVFRTLSVCFAINKAAATGATVAPEPL